MKKHKSWVFYIFGLATVAYVLAEAFLYALYKTDYEVPGWATLLDNIMKWVLVFIVYGTGFVFLLILKSPKVLKIFVLILYTFIVLMIMGLLPFMDSLFALF